MRYVTYVIISLIFWQCATSQVTMTSKDTFENITSGAKYEAGFFDYYLDTTKNELFLLVDKLDSQFLYVNSLTAGVGSNDIGLDRNQLGNTRIVEFEKRGNKLLLVQPNYRYRALSNNPDEVRAVRDAFAESVLAAFDVKATKGNKILISLNDFLLRDAHGVSDRLARLSQGQYKPDPETSALYPENIRNFPLNTEFEALLTFSGKAQGSEIRSVTPTPDQVTIRQHHSFIALPDDEYTPRKFDPRAGYFGISYYDYATAIEEPIEKRFISRHRLQKKDPSANKSEAVEPIIYYLDRGTPEPIRSALMEGASWWNQAFEAAGYTDAFQVKLLPEGADPMDVRYNMINWVHRSTRGWSYGSSVVDPRTGEILKGHVLLGSLRARQDYLIAKGLLAPYREGAENPEEELVNMALARLKQLAAHEVGHTIGLAHSYSSSTEGRASVMDYPHPKINLVDGEIDLSAAYDNQIGTWDKVAIKYGYADLSNEANPDQKLNDIIQESLEDGLTFISDQDARPEGGAHPYAHLWDNSLNAAEELLHILKVREIALENMGEASLREGEPYAYLEEILVPIYFLHRYQAEAASKWIGGMDYRYALKGDGQLITEIIPASRQMEAFDALMETLSPENLSIPEDLLTIIPPRPLGYSRNRELVRVRTGVTFDPLGAAESATELVLSLLLHPSRAQRLIEFHARNAENPSFDRVYGELIKKTWKTVYRTGIEREVQKVVQNGVLVHLLQLASDPQSSMEVKARANGLISFMDNHLKAELAKRPVPDLESHFSYAAQLIEQFREEKMEFEPPRLLAPPPGSPIGNACVQW